MVSYKTRRRIRRLRRHRLSGRDPLLDRLKVLAVSGLLAGVLYMTIAKQQGIAEPSLLSQVALHGPSWVPTIAQSSMPVALSRKGGQVIINGRSLSLAWSEREEKLGIADAALMQTMGVDLLSTDDAAQQPIQWFNDLKTDPIVLPTWLTGQYRYLDISQLAEKYGWQVRANGAVLSIATPAANVTAVRQGRQTWGDRIVVDVNQPTPCQVTEQSGEAIITIDAQAAPALVRSFKGVAGNKIRSLKVESGSGRTTIRATLAAGVRTQVSTLLNPNRIVIDVRSDGLPERDIVWAPGVRWRQQTIVTGAGKFPVTSLEIDLKQPGVKLKPILSNPSTVVGSAPLSTFAQQAQAAAAINGGFFNRNNRLPLGAIRQDNRWVSGPILNRGAIAWNDQGEAIVGRLNLTEVASTSTGKPLPILYLNSGYVSVGIARYTSDWGASYTTITDSEVVVTVQNSQVLKRQQADRAGRSSFPIPEDGYLLVIRGNKEAVESVPPGTTIELDTAVYPNNFTDYSHITGAGPLLVQNQRVVLDARSEQFSGAFSAEAAARSVIATLPNGNLVLMAVHNRANGDGPTLAETATIAQKLGANHALNLDGGSSTTLYLGGQILDRIPSTAARVNNGIGLFIEPY